MTNTLTWGFIPIHMPKLNSNMLAVISMFVVCMMMFLMIQPVLASHHDPCEPERSARDTALFSLALASALLAAALLSGQLWAIVSTTAAVGIAIKAVNDTQKSLDRCEEENGYDGDGFLDDEWIEIDGGGCISGGCTEGQT